MLLNTLESGTQRQTPPEQHRRCIFSGPFTIDLIPDLRGARVVFAVSIARTGKILVVGEGHSTQKAFATAAATINQLSATANTTFAESARIDLSS